MEETDMELDSSSVLNACEATFSAPEEVLPDSVELLLDSKTISCDIVGIISFGGMDTFYVTFERMERDGETVPLITGMYRADVVEGVEYEDAFLSNVREGEY